MPEPRVSADIAWRDKPNPEPQAGAIVLCGGKSTRMGTSKALLALRPGDDAAARAADSQSSCLRSSWWQPRIRCSPELPAGRRSSRATSAERGPLEGLRAGLKALPEESIEATLTSCDVPLLVPGFVTQMLGLLARPRHRGDGDRRLPASTVGRLSTVRAAAR